MIRLLLYGVLAAYWLYQLGWAAVVLLARGESALACLPGLLFCGIAGLTVGILRDAWRGQL